MVIAGASDIQGDFLITPQQLRGDYVRSGATPGGAGEGIWLGTTDEMIVDGSGVGGVTYSYGPTTDQDWCIYDVVVGFYCGTGAGPAVWGTMANPLTNGVLIQLNRVDLTTTQTLMALLNNTDFMRLGQWNHGDDGVTYWSIGVLRFPCVSGVVLHGNTGDLLQFVVRDDLTLLGGGTTFWAYVRGYKMANY